MSKVEAIDLLVSKRSFSVLPHQTQVQQFLGRCQHINSHEENFLFRIEQEPPCQVDVHPIAEPGSLHGSRHFNLGESFI